MKIKLIKALIGWLTKHYPYLLHEAVVPEHAHIGWNPGHKPQSGADTVLAEIERQGKAHRDAKAQQDAKDIANYPSPEARARIGEKP